jgi:neutral ceramidase
VTAQSQPLWAGYGEAVITPPLGVSLAGWLPSEGRIEPATEVLEDLLLQVVLIGLAPERLVLGLVLADVNAFPEDVSSRLRKDAAALGAASETWMIAATHNHSGPDLEPPPADEADMRSAPFDAVVVDRVRQGFAAAVIAALADLAPAALRTGSAPCLVNINRRERGPDGRMLGLPYLGRNPEGAVDHTVTTLRLVRAERRDIVLASYACHPAVLGLDPAISPDLFGPGRRGARDRLPDTAVMIAQGASGDVNPIIHPGSRTELEGLGTRLGTAIAAAVAADEPDHDPSLAALTATVQLPVRSRFPQDVGEMERDWIATRRASLRGMRALMVPIAAARIGRTELVGAGVELFATIGERLGSAIRPRRLLLITHCMTTLGYLPTAEAHREGGYEAVTSPFEPDADDRLVEAIVTLHRRLGV